MIMIALDIKFETIKSAERACVWGDTMSRKRILGVAILAITVLLLFVISGIISGTDKQVQVPVQQAAAVPQPQAPAPAPAPATVSKEPVAHEVVEVIEKKVAVAKPPVAKEVKPAVAEPEVEPEVERKIKWNSLVVGARPEEEKVAEPDITDKYNKVMADVSQYMEAKEFDKQQNDKLVDDMHAIIRDAELLSNKDQRRLRQSIIEMEMIGMARKFKG